MRIDIYIGDRLAGTITKGTHIAEIGDTVVVPNHSGTRRTEGVQCGIVIAREVHYRPSLIDPRLQLSKWSEEETIVRIICRPAEPT